MECLARCRTIQAALQAEELFVELKRLGREQQQESEEEDAVPARLALTADTYVALIKAWTRSGARDAPHRAEEMLRELVPNKHDDDDNDNNNSKKSAAAQPNTALFTAVIQCWARSRDVRKAAKALELLKQMRALSKSAQSSSSSSQQLHAPKLGMAPSLESYNAAIDACARTRGTAEQQLAALKIAFAVHKAIQQDTHCGGSGNTATFAMLLRAVGYLMPPGDERNQVGSAVFEKACRAGQVDVSVLTAMQRACDATRFAELLLSGETSRDPFSGYFDYDTIPTKWRRNVQTW